MKPKFNQNSLISHYEFKSRPMNKNSPNNGSSSCYIADENVRDTKMKKQAQKKVAAAV